VPDEPDKPDENDEPLAEGEPTVVPTRVPAADDDEGERPTVSPPFDPVAFARDIFKPSPTPMRAVRPGDPHTHATPAAGTQQQAAAAAASRPSGRTPPRRKTPTSTLSLANARIPSNLPPRPGKAKPQVAKEEEKKPATTPVDDEWADLELATRPPPADGPGEDPILEIGPAPPSGLELDEVNLDEERGAETVRRPVGAEAQTGKPASPQASRVPAEPAKPRSREMNDRMELGDYSGALEIAEEILRTNGSDIGAKTVAETCRTVLRQMYATRIGALDRVPVVMVPRDQLRWLSIDHKAGFVLSLVDGVSSLEMIIDVSGMPELDTLRILSELAQQRIIALR
jgi:hypothetical protein